MPTRTEADQAAIAGVLSVRLLEVRARAARIAYLECTLRKDGGGRAGRAQSQILTHWSCGYFSSVLAERSSAFSSCSTAVPSIFLGLHDHDQCLDSCRCVLSCEFRDGLVLSRPAGFVAGLAWLKPASKSRHRCSFPVNRQKGGWRVLLGVAKHVTSLPPDVAVPSLLAAIWFEHPTTVVNVRDRYRNARVRCNGPGVEYEASRGSKRVWPWARHGQARVHDVPAGKRRWWIVNE